MTQHVPGDVASRVRAALVEKGMSGRQLAEATGMSIPSCARRIRGEYDFTTSELLAVAAALGVPAASLLGDTCEQVPA